MNIIEHFKVQELVPPELYEKEKDESIKYLTNDILYSIEHVWKFFNMYYPGRVQILINTWVWGGKFKYRGFRPKDCLEGALYSQHKDGNALDFDVYYSGKIIPAKNTRKLILSHREQFPLITRMEGNVNWNHIDCKEVQDKTNITVFKQRKVTL